MSNETIKVTIPKSVGRELRRLVKRSGFIDSVSQAVRQFIIDGLERYDGGKKK